MAKFACELERDSVAEYSLDRTELIQYIEGYAYTLDNDSKLWKWQVPQNAPPTDVLTNFKSSRTLIDANINSIWHFKDSLLLEKIADNENHQFIIQVENCTLNGKVLSVHKDFLIYKDSSDSRLHINCALSGIDKRQSTSTSSELDELINEYPLCAHIRDTQYAFLNRDGEGVIVDINCSQSPQERILFKLDTSVVTEEGDNVEGTKYVVCTFTVSPRSAVIGAMILVTDEDGICTDHCLKLYRLDDKRFTCVQTSFQPFVMDLPESVDDETLNSPSLINLVKVCDVDQSFQALLLYCPYASNTIWLPKDPSKGITVSGDELEVVKSTGKLFDSCGFCNIISYSPKRAIAIQTDMSLMVVDFQSLDRSDGDSLRSDSLSDSARIQPRDTPQVVPRGSKGYIPQSYRLDQDDDEDDDVAARRLNMSPTYSEFGSGSPSVEMDSNILLTHKEVPEILQEIKGAVLLQEGDLRALWLSVCETWQKFEDKVRSLEVVQLDPNLLKTSQFIARIDQGQDKMISNIRTLDEYKKNSSENKIHHLQSMLDEASTQAQEAQTMLNSLAELSDSIAEVVDKEIDSYEDQEENLQELLNLSGLDSRPEWQQGVQPMLRRMIALVGNIRALNERFLRQMEYSKNHLSRSLDNDQCLSKRNDQAGNTSQRKWKTFGLPPELRSSTSINHPLPLTQGGSDNSSFQSSSQALNLVNQALRLCTDVRKEADSYDAALQRLKRYRERASRLQALSPSILCSTPAPSDEHSASASESDLSYSLDHSSPDGRRVTFLSNVILGSQALMNRRRDQITMWKLQREG